jgi:hypothetical protein
MQMQGGLDLSVSDKIMFISQIQSVVVLSTDSRTSLDSGGGLSTICDVADRE